MRLVVGLGNPRPADRDTRHNAGARVVERLAERWGVALAPGELVATAHVVRGGVPVVLARPRTFMNASGQAVARMVATARLAPADVLIVTDDLDLELGRLRLRPVGGSGGHNGVASVVEILGPDFPRLRLGIGRPPTGADVRSFVLEPFTPTERPIMQAAIERGADAVDLVLQTGVEPAMNSVNSTLWQNAGR